MVFNSLLFLLFFSAVLAVHHLLPLPWTLRKLFLLAASYAFYAAWNPWFLLLLGGLTVGDWCISHAMAKAPTPRARNTWLVASIIANLGALAAFKYGRFIGGNLDALAGLAGATLPWKIPELLLPVGISFHIFQSLSYIIDVWRGRTTPWSSLLDYMLFIAFFPQLVAGPIVRSEEFRDQCIAPRRLTASDLGWGLSLLVTGLFFKSVLTDGVLGPAADLVYDPRVAPGGGDAWIGTMAFAGQIYFDFAGYSICAVGAALCLGFRLPDNFHSPYAATGFSEFWRRWHVSLSSWLRDYLYIPLGGNRGGPWRTRMNLMLTMLLGGLWHGASWTYVAWGGLHGIFLSIERAFGGRGLGSSRWIPRIGTFIAVCVAWVFFRATSFPHAASLLKGMFGGRGELAPHILPAGEAVLAGLVVAGMLAFHAAVDGRPLKSVVEKIAWPWRAAALGVMMILLVTASGAERAFIYFQF